jgi:ribosomal protein L6P/L9E
VAKFYAKFTKNQNFMFQKSRTLCCFGPFSTSHRGHSLLNARYDSKRICLFSFLFLGERGDSFQRTFSTHRADPSHRSESGDSTIFSGEENQSKNESFWFSRLKIPAHVEVSHRLSSVTSLQNGAETQSTLLTFRGPLGSLEMNLHKIDTYGLSFFKLHTSTHAGEDAVFLDFFVKKRSTKKTVRFLSRGQTSPVFNGKMHHSKDTLCMLGSLVSLCRNAIEGVSFGFVIYLELLGVGYKASILTKNREKDQFLEVKVGQSHDILYPLPQSIKAFVIKPTLIGLYSIDKTELKQIAAEIRSIKPPEPYKGKGIRFKDEVFVTKIGKKK